jgi:hypothetical protein
MVDVNQIYKIALANPSVWAIKKGKNEIPPLSI